MSTLPADGTLHIEPAPSTWRARMTDVSASAGYLSCSAASFRAELGLPDDGSIVMSGHQAGFWHPGIVAKYAAVQAASALGVPVWLVADLDDNAPLRLRLPSLDERGIVRVHEVELSVGTNVPDGIPTGYQLPVSMQPAPPPELAELARRLDAVKMHASTLSEQVHRVASDLLEGAGAGRPAVTAFARAISSTTLFADVVKTMCEDPARCVLAYNAAVAREPGAGVRPLRANTDEDAWELPIWRVECGQPRRAVITGQGESLDPLQHAPRGLLMTGLMRIAACDLFIHGTGGGVYDRITEQWLGDWIEATLSPAAVVTATMLLDLGVDRQSVEKAQATIARAHRARHDPALLGDPALATEKRRLVNQIAQTERGSRKRADMFRTIHSLLETSRNEHQTALAQFDEQAQSAHAAIESQAAIMDRTYSFILHPKAGIGALRQQIHEAFGLKMRI